MPMVLLEDFDKMAGTRFLMYPSDVKASAILACVAGATESGARR